MTLHDAIARVLKDQGSLSVSEIADEIRKQGLYLRPKDGQPAGPNQISARINHHLDKFVRYAGKIHLRRMSPNKPLAQTPKKVPVAAPPAKSFKPIIAFVSLIASLAGVWLYSRRKD